MTFPFAFPNDDDSKILYSIGLFGEEKFKIIMKQFDEEHSFSFNFTENI